MYEMSILVHLCVRHVNQVGETFAACCDDVLRPTITKWPPAVSKLETVP